MVNYQQGKIYKIVCNTTNLVYIGSTCEKRLSTRLSHHVAHYKMFLSGKTNYTSSYETIKNGNYEIILIENYPCNNSDEIRMRERFHIENNVCVNLKNPIRTKEDDKVWYIKYYHDNKHKENFRVKQYYYNNKEKEKLRHYKYHLENKEKEHLSHQRYREDHKLQSKLQNKKYREENKEKIKLYKQKQYEANKDTINFKQREKRRVKNIYLEQLKHYNL